MRGVRRDVGGSVRGGYVRECARGVCEGVCENVCEGMCEGMCEGVYEGCMCLYEGVFERDCVYDIFILLHFLKYK